MFKKFVSLSNLTLLVALSLSTVAAYYSIIGLTAIFAGAVIPIIVMGSILEVGKITTTVWLRKYWKRCGWLLKMYLVPAVVLLALLTSMGIFGFLSRAHSDQGLVSGDAQAKLAIYDEKIKTQRENIELARKALQQMDAQVDQRLARGDSEQGAERAVQIRRQQQGERAKLQKEITEAQKEISKLNEERAPIAAETRKVEAEVGPIKYIAAMIYGDNPDANLLERAVRWVIILLVIVFDPLAIALVLAANASKEWDKEQPDEPKYDPDDGPLTDDQVEQIQESARKFVDHGEHPKDFDEKAIEEPIVEEQLPEPDPVKKSEPEKSIFEQHPYLLAGFDHFKETKPMVYKPEEELVPAEMPEPKAEVIDRPGDYLNAYNDERLVSNIDKQIMNDNTMQVKQDLPYEQLPGGYVSFEGKHMSRDALFSMRPDFLKLTADLSKPVNSGFGSKFPDDANKGDVFTRVDVLPNKVFKFDGNRWIEVNKETSNTYLYNTKYLDYLIEMIDKGQYDPELLSENERTQIEDYIKVQKLSKKVD